MSFEVPTHVRPVRDAVMAFMRERVEPAEDVMHEGGDAAAEMIRTLQDEAKAEGLWALGHPAELGGGGLPFMDYVYVNEVQGRSEFGQLALGTFTLRDPARDMVWVATGTGIAPFRGMLDAWRALPAPFPLS